MINFSSFDAFFAQITITDIIAILGCITGFLSLGINIRQVWKERFSLRVHFFKEDNLFFERIDDSYITELQGLLHVRFENRSALPLTIHTIHIYIDGKEISFKKYSYDFIKLITILKPNGGERWIEYAMDNQLKNPLRLEPYDAYDGFAFLPHYPSTLKMSQSVKIRLETTKGKKTKFSRIHMSKPVYEHGK